MNRSAGIAQFRTGPQVDDPSVVNVGGLLRMVSRAGPLVLLMTFAGAGIGIGLASLKTPTFSAHSKVLIEPRNWQIGSVDLAEGAYRYNENLIRSRIEVIQSTPVLSAVVDALQLDRVPSFTEANGEVEPGITEPEKRLALRTLYESLSITQSGLSDVIDIEATAETPQMAADIANAVARSYVDVEAAGRSAQLEETSTWLSRRLTELEANVTRSASELEAFRAQNTGAQDVRFNDLSREIDRLRDSAAGLGAAQREAVLNRIATIEGELARMGEARVRLSELERQAASDRQLYEQQLERAKVLQEAQDLRLSDARIIDPALPPLAESGPNRKLHAAAGGILGLLLGIVIAVLHGAYTRRVRGPQALHADLGLPVGAVVRRARRGLDTVMGPAMATALRPVELALSAARSDRGLVLVCGVGRGHEAALVAAGLARAAAAGDSRALVLDYSPGATFLMDIGVARTPGLPVNRGAVTTLRPIDIDLAAGPGLSAAGWPTDRVAQLTRDYDLVVLYVGGADSALARALVDAFDALVIAAVGSGRVSLREARRSLSELAAAGRRAPVVVMVE